jgi:hypothetical protein
MGLFSSITARSTKSSRSFRPTAITSFIQLVSVSATVCSSLCEKTSRRASKTSTFHKQIFTDVCRWCQLRCYPPLLLRAYLTEAGDLPALPIRKNNSSQRVRRALVSVLPSFSLTLRPGFHPSSPGRREGQNTCTHLAVGMGFCSLYCSSYKR